MHLFTAYKAIRANFDFFASIQMLDGFWSQIRWAWASFSFIILCGLSFCLDRCFFVYFFSLMLIYCYVIPYLSHKIIGAQIKVRLIDWLCIPIAVLVKSIGPNWYLCERILTKSVKYEKVER